MIESMTLEKEKPIESKNELSAYLERGGKEKSQWGIGTEIEKLVINAGTGEAATYEEVEKILLNMEKSGHWQGIREEGHLVALKGENSSITLEPGGQLELSGALCSDVHCSFRDFEVHNARVAKEAGTLGLLLLGLGVQPVTHRDAIKWLPKARYSVMGPYMLHTGDMGQHMMKKTAGVQVNIDYAHEKDCIDKLRLSMKLSPLFYALFANSPIMEGAPTGFLSTRGEIWSRTDKNRTGIIYDLFKEGAGYETYVDYALNVPMYFILRKGEYINLTGRRFTFAQYFKEGFEGHRATLADWDLHLSTLFTEARLRPQIEIRSADSLPQKVAPAVESLIKGLFYNDGAMEETSNLLKGLEGETLDKLYRLSWRTGLNACVGKWDLGKLAPYLLNIASQSLKEQNRLDEEGKDESFYLEALFEIAESGVTLAERLLEKWLKNEESKTAILKEHCGYLPL
ncbi:MAG: glutamate-cysteine ligase family protein [Deltaproteobacteria bacterium]|nr:glutamate-cysteine ligase family protein [Deltaproteobacteria bacterium]